MRYLVSTIGVLSSIATVFLLVQPAQAETTAPQKIVYNGHLFSSSGNPITTAHTVRFSIWNNSDVLASDIDGAGAINTLAANYLGWKEEHTVTPDDQGYFSVELGDVTPLFSIETFSTSDLLSMFLQVEVKVSTAANTSFEVLDVDPASATRDRSPVHSVPFALNADFIDQREIGTGSGDIALLQNGGVFSEGVVPGGTNFDTFTIDFNDTSAGDIILQFGDALGKTLSFDQVNSYFKFNDDVRIEGNLFVTGLINGIDITSIAATETHLKVSSGGALTIDIAAGSYRLNDTFTNYTGVVGYALPDASTNYVYFNQGGLQSNTSGFPTTTSLIPLAIVTTAGGKVTGVDDQRVFQSDDREKLVERVFRPMYNNASYKGDGTDNIGKLIVDFDAANQDNYYKWSTTRTTLQDYDVRVQLEVPEEFVSWSDPTIELTYRTSTANVADNKVDIAVFDTSGTAVTLSGSTTNLVNTAWTTTRIEFTGAPTWTVGEDFIIQITPSAKNNNEVHLGRLKVSHTEL